LAHIGSRGGGPSLTAFGHTTVELKNTTPSESSCQIFIDGEDETTEARTTAYVFQQFLELVNEPVEVVINHDFDLPVGCGYGASGAGAIGAALGLSGVLNLPLMLSDVGRIAHLAEVMNRTGLGTVGGQMTAGFTITTQAGFPFHVDKIIVPPGTRIICGSFGPVSTKNILGSWEWKDKIRHVGEKSVDDFLAKPTIQNFMDVARNFVSKVGMLETLGLTEVHDLITDLNAKPIYGASMNQLGQSVYAICTEDDAGMVMDVFRDHAVPSGPWNLEVCHQEPVLRVA